MFSQFVQRARLVLIVLENVNVNGIQLRSATTRLGSVNVKVGGLGPTVEKVCFTFQVLERNSLFLNETFAVMVNVLNIVYFVKKLFLL